MMLLLFWGCIYTDVNTNWYWSGNIYLRGTQGLETMENLQATMLYPTGEHLQEAVAPSGQNSSYRRFELDSTQYDVPMNIRIKGDNAYATLWSGRTPTHENPIGGENDLWLNGALYAQGKAFQQSFLNSMGLIDVPLLIDPDTNDVEPFTHLWGQPLDPTVWSGVHIEVFVVETDLQPLLLDTGEEQNQLNGDVNDIEWSSAVSYDVLIFEITEEGLILPLENPIPPDKEPSLFFSFSLPAGHTRLQMTTAEGEVIISDYPTLPGDVISALYFSLQED